MRCRGFAFDCGGESIGVAGREEIVWLEYGEFVGRNVAYDHIEVELMASSNAMGSPS